MKLDYRRKVLFILIIILILSSFKNISYASEHTQIKNRGVTFNTGVSSDQIRLIKDFFRALNKQNVPWGYNYDNRTKQLVRDYQKERGLPVDGIAGKSTIDRMNREIIDRNLDINLRVPSVNTKEDMVIINKSSNTVYLFTNGFIRNSYPIATGKRPNLTPNGKHKVVVKYVNPRWGGAGVSQPIAGGAPNNPLGPRWIGISYGGGGKYGLHGNSRPSSIGTYASLGCIRMFNKDVEKLYDRVKINTPVWIGDEDTLIKYGVTFKEQKKYKKPIKQPIKKEYSKANVKLVINGNEIKLKNPIYTIKGTTYYPFREILELVNAKVLWDEENQKTVGVLNGKNVEFKLNENKYKSNGEDLYLPKGQKAFINNSKTYVPIRNAMESLGFSVMWNESNKTINITN